MKPGRELDALVAEKVMGLKNYTHPMYEHCSDHYSTDIAAAWQVVEELKHLYPEVYFEGEQWEVRLYVVDKIFSDSVFANSESAAHAICLAALKAVGVDLDSNPR